MPVTMLLMYKNIQQKLLDYKKYNMEFKVIAKHVKNYGVHKYLRRFI